VRPSPAVPVRLRVAFWTGLVLLVAAGVGWAVRELGRPAAPLSLDYTVEVTDPAAERLRVTVTIEGSQGRAIPLGYSSNAVARTAPVRKFRLREATGTDGRELAVSRHRGMWRLDDPDPVSVVVYEVYLREGRPASEFAAEALSRIDPTGARLLGSDVFLFPAGRTLTGIGCTYRLPTGWALLHPFQVDATTAAYPDLESLYYSVVALGEYRTVRRQVAGLDLTLAIRGRYAFGDPDLMETVARICRHQVEAFGGAPREDYLLVVDPHPEGDDPQQLHYFGLHFNASMTVLLDERTDRRRLHAEPASIFAHEFFHNWNGELIGQDGYGMNWFVEGVTTWYAYRTRLALRMVDNSRFADEVRQRYREHYRDNPLRPAVSLAAAGERVLESTELTQLLYTGGLLLALALDHEIGAATGHDRGLEDLLLRLVLRAEREGGLVLERKVLEEELRRLTDTDFGPWLSAHVWGTEPPRLPGFLDDLAR